MKIKAHILRKNRTIHSMNVDENEDFFEFNNGIYNIQANAVNVTTQEGVINSHPELFYKEGCPSPITLEETKDEGSFLDEVVLENALAALAQGPGQFFNLIKTLIKRPSLIFIGIFALIILVAFLQGLILG